jgi:6-phosphogluconolactonase
MTRLNFFPDEQALALAAAEDWLTLARELDRPLSVALSGGRVAKTFFKAATVARDSFRLRSAEFFWADERCVPPDHPESNFLLANVNLLQPLGIGAEKIHRLKGEWPPDSAAAEGSKELRRIAGQDAQGVPVLDLVILGMGEDGHIASLMPNAVAAVVESWEPYVHVANSAKPPPDRLTLTYPALRAAQEVWVLISGAGKEEALRQSLRPDGKTPLARVIQSRQQTRIYCDLPAGLGAG